MHNFRHLFSINEVQSELMRIIILESSVIGHQISNIKTISFNQKVVVLASQT